MSPNDAANFLLFLQELRADPIGSHIILSAAVAIKPWLGTSGTPLTDVSGFAAVLDYIGVYYHHPSAVSSHLMDHQRS
jgi:chitinase